MDSDTILEAYCDAQDALAGAVAMDFSLLQSHGKKRRETCRELAGRYALPVIQIERLMAYGLTDRRTQNGVLPEVYGEILRKVAPEQARDMLDAAETGRWNVETAATAVKVHRTRRLVEDVQVRGAWRQIEAITSDDVTVDAVLGLPASNMYELAKPLRIIARFAGQAKKRMPIEDPNQTHLIEPEVSDGEA